MALFTISDLHLPLGVDKPMDIFGKSWENYVEKIEKEWRDNVGDGDLVVMPGDFSWAMYLEESKKDFEFLNALPGEKLLLKGNHDYWWETMNKMRGFLSENGFSGIDFLQNKSVIYKNIAICGTRGWSYIGLNAPKSTEDETIFRREVLRLEMSLADAKEKNPDEIIVFMHYPPILPEFRDSDFSRLMKEYGVKRCVYGHIHGINRKNAVTGVVDGIEYMLVSCDYLGFSPHKLCD